jgi:transposase
MVKKILKNRYLKSTKISEAKFRLVLKHFCLDDTVERTSQESGLSRKAILRLFGLLRQYIFNLCEKESAFSGEVEVDESYFGAKRIRGKRGRGARGKIPVLGLLKRGGKVYTQVVENCSREQLLPIIQGKILSKSTVYSDGWRSYDGLIYQGYHHYRIHHHENEFARGKNHVNGIESFWSFTKARLLKMKGVRKDKFVLHLKESEFRWNYRKEMYQKLLKTIRKSPIIGD